MDGVTLSIQKISTRELQLQYRAYQTLHWCTIDRLWRLLRQSGM